MRIRQVLHELNIINLPDIEKYATTSSNRVKDENARLWYFAGVRKWLVNNEESAAKVTTLSKNAPPWMAARMDSGVALYRFDANPAVTNKLNHVCDWLNSLTDFASQTDVSNPKKDELRREAKTLLSRLDRIGFQTSFEHADRWFAAVNKAASEGADEEKDPTNVVPVIKGERGVWVELKSQAALTREGSLMGHCVGGGGYDVEHGAVRIFSLRDARNVPHVTVEISHGTVQQVKGKENKPPIAKYTNDVITLLNTIKATAGKWQHDLTVLGILETDGKFGTLYDVAHKIKELPGGGEVIWHDNTYYFWKNGSYASWVVTGGRHDIKLAIKDLSIPTESPEMKVKVEAALMAYWNSLDPIPEPYYGHQDLSKTMHFHNGRWGTLEEHQTEVSIDGMDVRALETDSEIHYYIKDDSGTSIITLYKETEGGGGKKYPARVSTSTKINSSSVAKFLNAIHFTGEFTKSDAYKIYFHGGEWFAGFDPERLGYTPVGTGEMFFSGGKDPKNLMDSSGDVILNANTIHSNFTERDPDTLRGLRNQAPAIAAFLNEKLPDGARGTFARGMKEKLSTIGLSYDAKKGFKATSAIKASFSSRGMDIRVNGTSMEVQNMNGDTVATFKKSDGFYNFSSFGAGATTRIAKQTALLAMSDWENVDPEKRDVGFGGNSLIAPLGLMLDGDNHPAIIKIEDKHPSRTILEFDDGRAWVDAAYTPMDSKCVEPLISALTGSIARDITGHRYVLRDAGNKDLVRVLSANNKGGKGRVYAVWLMDGNVGKPANKESIKPFVPALQALLQKEQIGAMNSYFITSLGLVQDHAAAIHDVDAVPRFKQFSDGLITYEDGHKWVRSQSEKNVWLLMGAGDSEYSYQMKVTLSGGRISSTNFNNKAHLKPRDYMPYFTDLMDIIHDINENPLSKTAPA